jgi:hypothetical protein
MPTLAEIFASAPVGHRLYMTLEFIHPAFRDDAGDPTTIRLVQGFEDITATLEATAPEDPGDAVLFTAAPFEVDLPLKDVKGRHDLNLVLDGVSGDVVRQLELQAAANRSPVKVILREYVSSNLSAPQGTPIKMTLLNPSVSMTRVSASAVFADVVNRAYPGIVYKLSTHPGLA